jgi:hypothetical protein
METFSILHIRRVPIPSLPSRLLKFVLYSNRFQGEKKTK